MDSNTKLIERLVELQNKGGNDKPYTNSQMARLLGCNRQLYQATVSGKIAIGLTILKCAVRTFPELKGEVLIFLSDDVDILTNNVTKGTDHKGNAFKRLVSNFCLRLKRITSA